jgi:uracil-DNA glycosylase
MGVGAETFYDRDRTAILPMALCFPGYDARGSDLPPPPVCARTWHARIMEHLPDLKVTLLIGGAAQRWHLGTRAGVTQTVAAWRDHAPAVFPLPHPSWRNTAWLKANPWMEAELVPALRSRLKEVLGP